MESPPRCVCTDRTHRRRFRHLLPLPAPFREFGGEKRSMKHAETGSPGPIPMQTRPRKAQTQTNLDRSAICRKGHKIKFKFEESTKTGQPRGPRPTLQAEILYRTFGTRYHVQSPRTQPRCNLVITPKHGVAQRSELHPTRQFALYPHLGPDPIVRPLTSSVRFTCAPPRICRAPPRVHAGMRAKGSTRANGRLA